MRKLGLVLLLFAAACAAQSVCKDARSETIEHKDGVTVLRIALMRDNKPLPATAFLPDASGLTPAAIFTHSRIQRFEQTYDLLVFARALARAGAAAVVLDGTIKWDRPSDDFIRPQQDLDCAGQWLLNNVHVDTSRLMAAGTNSVGCISGTRPCMTGHAILNFATTKGPDPTNTEVFFDPTRQLAAAEFVTRHLKLRSVQPEWLDGALRAEQR